MPPSSFAFGGGQQQQQQLQQQQLQQQQQPPDDSALKEILSIKDSYVPGPGNHRHRFKYLFLNVVENPNARVKPADVDELQWREAMRRAGGSDNPDHLWPTQSIGFKGLLARKAAQDEAIKEHSERLTAVQQAIQSLAARQEAVLKEQLEGVKKRHTALCQQLLRIVRYIDALEGRFAHAMGFRTASARETLHSLASQLNMIESGVGPGSSGGLQGKIEALIARSRQRAGAVGGGGGVGGGVSEMEASAGIDPSSLHSAYTILSEYAEALGKMQTVLRRCTREVGVLAEEQEGGGGR